MKKALSLILAVCLLLLMTACGSEPSDEFDGTSPITTSLKDDPISADTSESTTSETSEAEPSEDSDSGSEIPVVYFTSDISAEGMLSIYEALGWVPTGKVAVKLSTGEPPASNYLRPELIKDVVETVDGTIVECNTAYGGSRSETVMHYQVAKDHGFTDIADFQILDEDGSMTLPVDGGSVLTKNYVGAAFADYDSYVVLSHFKGHAMAGFGGSIKNISIGLGSSEGKCWIHSGGKACPVHGAAIRLLLPNPWRRQESPYPITLGTASESSTSTS